MGVAGCGKSSLGKVLSETLGATFIEGDSFHPPENIARMSAGTPLTDDDRAGWLAQLAGRLAAGRARGENMVLACSALKRRYRDKLREGDPELLFVHLNGTPQLIAERMAERSAHFMPQSLVESQFGDLEALQADERAVVCDIHQSLETIRDRVAEYLAG
ncbi:gluconokinase [Crenobacter sp. SG2305]|uniref:gluconokinase n=1 Tax=Crenobacter oryzisoli TaxID=3056844 RepID=UPI0025AAC53A|nr:gluconokinase [Crenobacter sp. SG2305]MDN0085262.1 gluconokinase [Crenobacter sp. SG2305]